MESEDSFQKNTCYIIAERVVVGRHEERKEDREREKKKM